MFTTDETPLGWELRHNSKPLCLLPQNAGDVTRPELDHKTLADFLEDAYNAVDRTDRAYGELEALEVFIDDLSRGDASFREARERVERIRFLLLGDGI